MIAIRVHGRGGQGNVTLAELIGMAAFYDGKNSQSFPNFGVERKGAPVVAYAKIDKHFIRSREQIYNPDYVIIQDPSLIKVAGVLSGITKDTVVIINSNKSPKEICPQCKGKVYCVAATEIALKEIGRPIANTAMLGVFTKVSGVIKSASAKKAIKENLGHKFPAEILEKNIKAHDIAYNSIK